MIKKEISKERAMQRLLGTHEGSRVMRPTYGVDWNKYIDQIEDPMLAGHLVEKIEEFVPSIQVVQIKKSLENGEQSLLIETTDGNSVLVKGS